MELLPHYSIYVTYTLFYLQCVRLYKGIQAQL